MGTRREQKGPPEDHAHGHVEILGLIGDYPPPHRRVIVADEVYGTARRDLDPHDLAGTNTARVKGAVGGCHSWILAYSGNYEEALTAFDRAMELSPSDRRRGLWLTGRGVAQFGLGDFAGALDSARELIALSPEYPSEHRMKCASLACLGRLVEARRASEHLMKLLPQHDVDVAIDRQPFRDGLGRAHANALKQAGLKGSGATDRSKVQAKANDVAPTPYPVETTMTKDGVRIAWSRFGSGPPLVAAVRWLGNPGLDHENPFSNEIVRALADRFSLIQFDHRGMGQSQRDIEHLTLHDLASDLEAVSEAAGLDRFAMFTMAHGCPTVFEYIRNNPGRIKSLALYGSSATGWRGAGWEGMTERTEAIMAVARLGWDADEPTFRRLIVNAVIAEPSSADARWLDDYLRKTISARVSVQLIEAISNYDFRTDLRALELPVLVLHASGDTAIPVSHGKCVAEAIPGAVFHSVTSKNHIFTQTDERRHETLDVVMDFLNNGDMR